MGRRIGLTTDFKAVYVSLPLEMVEVRRASLLLLLQWIREDFILNPDPTEKRDGSVDGDRDGNDGRVRASLFSMEDVIARKRVATSHGVYAWFIGHDGSAYRMAVGSR